MPKIVNVRNYRPNDPAIIYCGRAWAGWDDSPLANPFRPRKPFSDEMLTECLAKYETWLRERLSDMVIRGELDKIKPDSLLGCWCFPRRCHCEIILVVWKELQ